MATKIYNQAVYMPQTIVNIGRARYTPHYSQHAQEAAKSDRYGLINLPVSVVFSGSDIIECEVIDNTLNKIIVRVSYDNKNDIILVMLIKSDSLFVKTVWLNSKSDNHRTLKNRSIFSTK